MTSPTFADLLDQLLAEYPAARWHQYERRQSRQQPRRLSARIRQICRYALQFDKADVVVSLDSDFLSWSPASCDTRANLRAGEKSRPARTSMNRLYVIESGPTITGAMADHRFPMRSSDIAVLAQTLASGGSEPSWLPVDTWDLERSSRKKHRDCRRERSRRRFMLWRTSSTADWGTSERQSFIPSRSSPIRRSNVESLRQLTEDMAAGRVDTLVILGGNPAYNAPADLEFRRGALGCSAARPSQPVLRRDR